MKVQNVPIDTITPYEDNPRINDQAVESVANSIKEFGFRQPIVVDENRVIIAGHTRYKAALHLGLDKVPIHIATGLTPEQIRAYRIADNKTSDLSDWDYDMLAAELADLDTGGYDIAATGFSGDELEGLLNDFEFDPEEDPDDDEKAEVDVDEIPETPDEVITQPGDLWILGQHRLLCGDSTSIANWKRLLDGRKIDLLLTDPPYGIEYVGRTEEQMTIDNDGKDDQDLYQLLTRALGNALRAMKPGSVYYVWHAPTMAHVFHNAVIGLGEEIKQILVWCKDTMILGRQDYQWQHESCIYGWKDGGAHAWFSDRTQTTVLRFNRPTKSTDHPTMKPVDLMSYQIANSSAAGELVCDPFLGSGSTLIASARLGRRCYGMELSPKFCDVIVKRFEHVTGQKAERQSAEAAPVRKKRRTRKKATHDADQPEAAV